MVCVCGGRLNPAGRPTGGKKTKKNKKIVKLEKNKKISFFISFNSTFRGHILPTKKLNFFTIIELTTNEFSWDYFHKHFQ